MLRLLSPLGVVKDKPDLVRVSCWRTESASASKFTSCQRNPSSSPSLSPAVIASMYKASNLSPLAASSNLFASWGERALISFFMTRGGVTASHELRGMRLWLTAYFRLLLRTVWMSFTVRPDKPEFSLERESTC